MVWTPTRTVVEGTRRRRPTFACGAIAVELVERATSARVVSCRPVTTLASPMARHAYLVNLDNGRAVKVRFHWDITRAEAIEQVSDEDFFALIDPEANSIALIVKHIAGNLRSRWTDFLTTDGEKDFRDRDSEFELTGDSRESLMAFWESGWKVLFDNIEPLTVEDFSRKVTIRGEPHSICEALRSRNKSVSWWDTTLSSESGTCSDKVMICCLRVPPNNSITNITVLSWTEISSTCLMRH